MTVKTRPKRVAAAAAKVNLGHGRGQICPFCWQWFGGADLVANGWELAPLITPEGDLLAWYRRFLELTPEPVTPQGIEDYPALAAMLTEHRTNRKVKKP